MAHLFDRLGRDEHLVAGLFHPLRYELAEFRRAAFVIGTDGVVKYAEQTATPKDLPNFDAVKAALAKLA